MLNAVNTSIAFVSTRPLSSREICLAKEYRLKRYYLPELPQEQSEIFFKQFDNLWNVAVGSFDPDHHFWRNVVSSKMQEWEGAFAYLALQLFTLSKQKGASSETILIICASIEEADLCYKWGKRHNWRMGYETSGWIRSFWRRFSQEAVNIFRFVYLAVICLYYKIISGNYRPSSTKPEPSILISSLFYSGCFKKNGYRDPFFSNLHHRIDHTANTITYICAPLDDVKKATGQIKTCSDARIISPFALIRISQLLRLIVTLFIRRSRLPKATFGGCDFSALLMWNARRVSYFNFHAEIYYVALRNLFSYENFSRLIIPYEGNVFERACIQAFRGKCRKPIIGYSHAVVFPLNLKIRLSPCERHHRPEPDQLLCTGPENKTLLASVGKRDPDTLLAACSLRYIPVDVRTPSGNNGKKNILVALDGVRGSSAVLDWLLENAAVFNNQSVVIRAHPNVPLPDLRKQCLHPWPSNFIASREDLATDLANAYCVIYRQTSVGMQALLNGIEAIHLNVDAPLGCDPLMNMAGIWRVSHAEALTNVFRRILDQPEYHKQARREDASTYVARYFSPPDPERVALFFS